jgi:hypothetical protein
MAQMLKNDIVCVNHVLRLPWHRDVVNHR